MHRRGHPKAQEDRGGIESREEPADPTSQSERPHTKHPAAPPKGCLCQATDAPDLGVSRETSRGDHRVIPTGRPSPRGRSPRGRRGEAAPGSTAGPRRGLLSSGIAVGDRHRTDRPRRAHRLQPRFASGGSGGPLPARLSSRPTPGDDRRRTTVRPVWTPTRRGPESAMSPPGPASRGPKRVRPGTRFHVKPSRTDCAPGPRARIPHPISRSGSPRHPPALRSSAGHRPSDKWRR